MIDVYKRQLYDYMSDTVAKVAPGSGGVLFTPWLHGNRCPFEDSAAAGMFFNLRLETGKAQMLRAVLEGICFHLRWMLEVQEKKTKTSDPVSYTHLCRVAVNDALSERDLILRRVHGARSKDSGHAEQ